MSDDPEELKQHIAELEAENERLREQQESAPTRRSLLRAAGIAGAGAISVAAATGTAAADPQGTLQGTSGGDPLLKVRADRLVLVPRTSPVSNPSDGTLTFRSDL